VGSPGPSALSRIIVPLLPDADVSEHAGLALDLAGPDGQLILAAVVPVRHGEDLPAATAAARAARRELRALARSLSRRGNVEIAVRAAGSMLSGLQQIAGEFGGTLLLALPLTRPLEAAEAEPYRGLLAAPVANVLLARLVPDRPVRSVLVSARGGPHAELALETAQRIGRSRGATVTVMRVDAAGSNLLQRQQEQLLFQELLAHTEDASRLRTSSLSGDDVEATVLRQAVRHDLLVLGSQIAGPGSGGRLGAVPEAALRSPGLPVLVARARGAVTPAIFRRRGRRFDELVNAWFVENTAHCRDYSNLDELLGEKRRRGCTVAAVLLEGGSLDTLPAHARVLVDELQAGIPLVDDALFVCGAGSKAAGVARAEGLRVEEVDGAAAGQRGRLLRAALATLRADIVVWLDADTRNPHQKIVYGLVGPLIMNAHLRCVQGFFGLPREAPDADLRTLVGELTVRPLLDLHFPDLTGFIAPLAVEQAFRSADARSLPLFSGPAAPLGLLVDVVERYGLQTVGQVGLDEGIARPLSLEEASRLAFSAAQILGRRAGLPVPHGDAGAPPLKLLRESEGRFEISVAEAGEEELPALGT
jgi:glucosyl-3-phosphoglycerate synthase